MPDAALKQACIEGAAVGSGNDGPPHGVARALCVLTGGGAVDYEGASVSLDWDEHGALLRGHIGIWRITASGTPRRAPGNG